MQIAQISEQKNQKNPSICCKIDKLLHYKVLKIRQRVLGTAALDNLKAMSESRTSLAQCFFFTLYSVYNLFSSLLVQVQNGDDKGSGLLDIWAQCIENGEIMGLC